MPAAFTCTLVTPEAQVFEKDVTAAVVPAHDGQVGILHDRAPLLTKLGYGRLSLTLEDGEQEAYFVGGGFAQVKGNVVTLLTDEAIPAEDLDAEQAKTALDEATAMPTGNAMEQARRQIELERARGMIQMTGA